ncbi:MAG: PEGA domain-containing protein [Microcoleus sp.]
MNKTQRIWLIILVVIGLLGFASWQVWLRLSHGTLQLTASPTDVIVTIDNTKKTNAGAISLVAGKHTIEVSRDSFKSVRFDMTITADKTVSKDVFLDFTDATSAASWAAQNPVQAQEREAQAGKSITDSGNKLMTSDPILNQLPHQAPSYIINYGTSVKHPDDPNAIALYIYTAAADAKAKAMTWMESQGFNPSTYEIIYSGYDDPAAATD